MNMLNMTLIIDLSYFLAAVLFIFGLKRMSSPVTARGGIVWAGVGMGLATIVTFLFPGMTNYLLMVIAMPLTLVTRASNKASSLHPDALHLFNKSTCIKLIGST